MTFPSTRIQAWAARPSRLVRTPTRSVQGIWRRRSIRCNAVAHTRHVVRPPMYGATFSSSRATPAARCSRPALESTGSFGMASAGLPTTATSLRNGSMKTMIRATWSAPQASANCSTRTSRRENVTASTHTPVDQASTNTNSCAASRNYRTLSQPPHSELGE